MNRESFLHCLRESNLLRESQIAEVMDRDPPINDPYLLGELLVEKGLLTRFQLARIWGRQPKGLVLGQYRLLEEIGRGGFGRVYKAVHGLMNRVVAVKVIAPEVKGRDKEAAAWFRREVLAATKLNHPNIAMAYDADEVDGVLFLAMEYVDGPSLERYVEEEGALPINVACAIILQAAQALHYAHERGMVHRDIKPANFLLPRLGESARSVPSPVLQEDTPAGTGCVLVKIVDFGLARLAPRGSPGPHTLGVDGGGIGTPTFVSPEQARDIHNVDIRSDLYSLGCTFYYALTGQLPFSGRTAAEVLAQQLEKEPRSPELVRPEIPPALAGVVHRLMAKKPEHRFQTPAELIAELRFVKLSLKKDKSLPIPRSLLVNIEDAKPPLPVTVPGIRFMVNPAPSPRSQSVATPPDFRESPSPIACGARPSTLQSGETEQNAGGDKADESSLQRTASNKGSNNHKKPGGRPFSVETRDDVALKELWREWSSVVDALVRRKTPQMHDSAYRDLYAGLVEEARSHTASAAPSRQPSFARLAHLIEPWVSLRSLVDLDHKSLQNLCHSCRILDGDLGVNQDASTTRWFASGVVFCVLALLFGACIIFSSALHGAALPSLFRSAESLIGSHPLVSMLVLGPVTVIVATGLLARILR